MQVDTRLSEPRQFTTRSNSPRETELSQRRPLIGWSLFFRILISVALLAWLLPRISFSEIGATLAACGHRWPFLLLAFLLPTLGTLVAAYRWKLLLAAQKQWTSLRQLVEAGLVGTFYNQLLPSTVGGDIVRAWWVTDSKPATVSPTSPPLSLGKNLTVVGIDRLVGIVGICLTAFLAAIANPAAVEQLPGTWTLIALALPGIALLIVLPYSLVAVVRRRSAMHGKLQFLHRGANSIHEALAAYRGEKLRLCGAAGLSVLLQGLIILQYCAVAAALGISVSVWELSVIVPIVALVSLIPITVNGIGIRENALALLGAAFGISPTHAAMLAWMIVLITIAYGLVGGLIHLRGQRDRVSIQHLLQAARARHEKP